jgi:hypothetical protein
VPERTYSNPRPIHSDALSGRIQSHVEKDHLALVELHTTTSALVALLRKVLGHGNRRVGRVYEVISEVWLGATKCPLCHKYPNDMLYQIRHKPSGLEVEMSEAQIHMIEEHGFFGGLGQIPRIEPAHLAQVLEIGRKS